MTRVNGSDVDRIYASLLQGQHLPGDDELEQHCNETVDLLFKQRNGSARDKVTAMRLTEPYLKTTVIEMVYAGDDPKEVPIEHMKHAMQHPSVMHPEEGEYNQRVHNPVSGIRAFCMTCQGGFAPGIRNCTAPQCIFWPFRMGKNSFYGRLKGEDTEAEAEDTEAEIEELEAQRVDPLEDKDADQEA